MKKKFIISVIFNIMFVLFATYMIYKKGGISYLTRKSNIVFETKFKQDFDFLYNDRKSLFESLPNDKNEIIFLGNSLIDGGDWYELFGIENIKNRGIGGDVINGVIDRLDEVVESNPKKIFLMIGINDIGLKRSVNQILSDYEQLVLSIKRKSPKTELYIQSILPTDNFRGGKVIDIQKVNNGLIKLSKQYDLTYINLFDIFKTKGNKINPTYTYDGLHINTKGYWVWKKAIENYVTN